MSVHSSQEDKAFALQVVPSGTCFFFIHKLHVAML